MGGALASWEGDGVSDDAVEGAESGLPTALGLPPRAPGGVAWSQGGKGDKRPHQRMRRAHAHREVRRVRNHRRATRVP